jgi:type I restriction enzyme S subunit
VSLTLKPYPKYKESALGSLGAIPAHWSEVRAKYLFREIDQRSISGDEELLSVSHLTGVTPRSQKNVTMFMAESNVGHKRCQPDDLVINTMWAWMGALGVSRFSGIVSPSYGVYRPTTHRTNSSFIDQLLRTNLYVDEYVRSSTGINSSRLRLYPESFLRIPILIPPVEEQNQITRVTNSVLLATSKLIRAKRRVIELLNEQKQVIIHRAVTRSLDPHVRLKPSGFEWLPEMPETWKRSKVKVEFSCFNTQRVPLSGTERGLMTSRLYDYYGASGVIDKVEDYIFDDDLLLIAEDGANLVLRNLPLAILAHGKFWVNNHAHILKPKTGNLEFLAMLMECIDYRPWISGAAQPKLTQDRLMSIPIFIPPRDEQDMLVAQIKAETRELNHSVENATRELALLREYRNRLIADVVTGKLDVRGVVLPPMESEEALEPLSEAGEAEEDDATVDEEMEAVE